MPKPINQTTLASRPKKTLDDNVSIFTSFSPDTTQKLFQYQKKTGMPKVQDVIRMAVAQFLSRSGYL